MEPLQVTDYFPPYGCIYSSFDRYSMCIKWFDHFSDEYIEEDYFNETMIKGYLVDESPEQLDFIIAYARSHPLAPEPDSILSITYGIAKKGDAVSFKKIFSNISLFQGDGDGGHLHELALVEAFSGAFSTFSASSLNYLINFISKFDIKDDWRI